MQDTFCNHKVRNKLVMAPMTTWSSNQDLTVSDQELSYYQERAHNFGIVITATTFPIKKYQGFDRQFYAGDDSYLPSLTKLAKSIKDQGALAILQIFLPGRSVSDDVASLEGVEVAGASDVPSPRDNFSSIPRTLETSEVKEIVQAFKDTFIRAIKAGFDGVEIHGANTYLIQQFVSPNTNLRDDEYGQDKLLFTKEIVQAAIDVKSQLKPDFIIGYRFSPEEKETPGIRLENTYELINYLCETQIDYLHVSLPSYNSRSFFDEDLVVGKELLKVINQRKPLIGVGGIKTHKDVEAAFEIGYDFVAIGLSVILHPNFINCSDEELNLKITSEDLKDRNIPTLLQEKLARYYSV